MDKKKVRCAIYTRKSSEEGLEQNFNSLDAQREACEAYIKSQMHEGWFLLDKQYNDGGFSGGTMERPAFKELLKDIEKLRQPLIDTRCLRASRNHIYIISVFRSSNKVLRFGKPETGKHIVQSFAIICSVGNLSPAVT